MVLVIVWIDEEVIHVNDELSFSNHIPERVWHELLKSGEGIGHAEEHDSWFIESSVGDEGHFPLVTFLDTNIVVPPLYVKLGEDFGIFEFVNQVRDER